MTDEEKSLETLEQEIAAETASQEALAQTDGTESTTDAADSTVTDGEQSEDTAALKAELELARKEKAQVEMERNLLRNKQKEAERKALESVDKTKLDELNAAYETLLAEKNERDAREAEELTRKTANEFRESIIAQRPEKVQKAAKALIEKNESNLAWSDARDEADAASQLNAQLDALESVLGVEPPATVENPKVHANNPGNPPADKAFEAMSLEEMERVLPHAPIR